MISRCVYKYCYEDISLIENYEKAVNDDTQIWHCHHRLEIQDNKIFSKEELIDLDLYFDRPASELIFMTEKDHHALHLSNLKEETRIKLSENKKGKKNPNYGKIYTDEEKLNLSLKLKSRQQHSQSEETRKLLSKINTGKKLSQETKDKISKSLKGRVYSEEERQHHVESWTEDKRLKVSERFKGKPKSEETKRKMSEAAKKRIEADKNFSLKMSNKMKESENYKQAMAKRKGEKCWNNGVITVRRIECPEGFVPGRLIYKK